MVPTLDSQQVSWWSVRDFIMPVLNQVNDWPMLGAPAWCSLAHDDPRKWAALLDASQHWALRIETAQEARAEASRSVSAAAEMLHTPSGIQLSWAAIGRERLTLNAFYEHRPWLKRAGGHHS